jgi:dihydropteroate synthase
MQGRPETMHKNPQYGDVVKEVLDYFIGQIAVCRKAGINDIIIDPGFGLVRPSITSLLLLKSLDLFHILDAPILAGAFKKGNNLQDAGHFG